MHQLISIVNLNLGGYAQSETKFYEWTNDWITFWTVIFKAQKSHWFLAIINALRKKTLETLLGNDIEKQMFWVIVSCGVVSFPHLMCLHFGVGS